MEGGGIARVADKQRAVANGIERVHGSKEAVVGVDVVGAEAVTGLERRR
jgi:hypothetical protein